MNPNPNDYTVVLSMHHTNVAGTRLLVRAVTINVHQQYNANTMANDIDVIAFGNLMPSQHPINTYPACLPSRTYNHNEDARFRMGIYNRRSAKFHFPTNHTNLKGQVRRFLQYGTKKQYFTVHTCTPLIGCTGCVCSRENNVAK